MSTDTAAARGACLLGDHDLHLFNEGTHLRLWEKLGAHVVGTPADPAVHFALWAPNARAVRVRGDFNDWNETGHRLEALGRSGLWWGVIPGVRPGALYKYNIEAASGERFDKADPFAFRAEPPPGNASVVWPLGTGHDWQDGDFRQRRRAAAWPKEPVAIYEVHLGSWRRGHDGRELSYRDIADPLIDHVRRCGFTHVQFLPLMEHPFGASWGYQTTGYFAATWRHGTPEDLMALIDRLHLAGIGVLLDWVPSHFAADAFGLARFDGTALYEHADRRQGFHPDWGSLIFNYGRHEVRSFLLSSAMFWLEMFHADGLRVDAVASMLYLDYSRRDGEWIANLRGGRENLDAIEFLRHLNIETHGRDPGVLMIAEESTAWPGVSRPVYSEGLGFGMKWDMGWMNDTLRHLARDPVHRQFHYNELTFRMLYAFDEQFVLALSHDEVVHGKGSLLGRMPGDRWQKRANLRLLLGYMYGLPGKKLLFMGGEFGQLHEWNHDRELDWALLDDPEHEGLRRWVADLNAAYRSRAALHELDFEPAGFRWIVADDTRNSVLVWERRGRTSGKSIIVACNLTPVVHSAYRIGVARPGRWREILNSDAKIYGGSGVGNLGAVETRKVAAHGERFSLEIQIPPLGVVMLEGPPADATLAS